MTGQTGSSVEPFSKLEKAAHLGFPSALGHVLPESVKDSLRSLRERLLGRIAMRRLPRDKQFIQSHEDSAACTSLSVIIPVHDSPEVTKRCLESLERFAVEAEIILVDDASKLQETRALLENFASRNHWVLIRNDAAMGHSGASAAGVSRSTRPYLCLLNSDTVVTPRCWRLIMQAFESDPKVGAAGPSTSWGGWQTLPLAKYVRHYLNESQICAYAESLLGDSVGPVLTDVPAVIGFALFISRSLWDQLGGFDKALPDYGNEIDLCRRIHDAGYRTVWVSNSYIHHLAGASYGKTIGAKGIAARKKAATEMIDRRVCRRRCKLNLHSFIN